MPQASINIDVDTLCEEIDGDTRVIRSAELRAITYHRLVPRFLELLDKHGLKATFFVIGRDVTDHEPLLRDIAASGHELANHTMTHPKQLVHLDDETIEREVRSCGAALEALSGRPTVGFRAPGYTISPRVLSILRRSGYAYDSSLNTSYCYYALKKTFKAVRLRDKHYLATQHIGDLRAPRMPYRVAVDALGRRDDEQAFIEIPISVVPYVSYPFVTSLLLHFGLRPTLWALDALVSRGRFVNCELHTNEFTDRSDIDGYGNSFYMTREFVRIDLAKRLAYFDRLFGAIKAACDVVLLRDVVA